MGVIHTNNVRTLQCSVNEKLVSTFQNPHVSGAAIRSPFMPLGAIDLLKSRIAQINQISRGNQCGSIRILIDASSKDATTANPFGFMWSGNSTRTAKTRDVEDP
jgi:hypothetical protein